MKNIFVLLLFILLSGSLFSQYKIDSAKVRKHIYILAADSMQGRGTGTIGQEKAAAYISGLFEEFGLKPINSSPGNEGYYQRFCIYSPITSHIFLNTDTVIPAVRRKARLTFNGQIRNVEFDAAAYVNRLHFVYLSAQKLYQDSVRKVVFCKNTAVLPADSLVTAAFHATETASALDTIIKLYQKKHIKSFIVSLSGTQYEKVQANMPGDRFLVGKNETGNQFYKLGMLKPKSSKLPGTIYDYYIFCMNHPDCEIIFFPPALHKKIFGSDNKEDMVQKYLRQSVFSPGIWDSIVTCNVAGMIEGKSKKNEYVVVGAHYDHVGMTSPDRIFYGADDNASGTTAVIEIAALMTDQLKKGIQPNKSIVFVAFTAEEEGLIGSEAFVINPPVNAENISAMVNMDMIGRSDDKHNNTGTFSYGLALGSKKRMLYRLAFKSSVEEYGGEVVEKPGMTNKLLYTIGSDHHAFARRNIPSFVFFTGLHDDYHKPADTPDKIRFSNLALIARIASRLTYGLAE